MKKCILLIAITIIAAINFSAVNAPENQARVIVNKMMKVIAAGKGFTYTMRSQERLTSMKGLRGGDIYTKVNVSPRKIYMKMITDPNKGTEVLYAEGERSNKALVNPGKLLPTIKLSPFNSLITKDQHHTILSSGFDLVGKIISEGIRKADEQGKFDVVFKYEGDVVWNGRNCYKLVIEDPTWTYTTYIAKKGETMYTVSTKLLIPEYSLVELNGVKNFEEDLGGKTLKVPTTYAKKTVFYIDKVDWLPVFQEMSDDKGVFERYEFRNLIVNPVFKADEFTEHFSEYQF